jgi:MYXO-CTERM domain-containing protein
MMPAQRRRPMIPMLLLGAIAPAAAFESVAQPFVLEDYANLYQASEFDTGWFPAGSPLQVRFQIVSEGGAAVVMEGEGQLSWPDALTLSLTPEPGTGALMMDAALAAVTSIQFDVAGYQWSQEIDRRSLDMDGEATFDPFLLTGGTPDRVVATWEGNETTLIDWALDVFTGVSVEFTMDLGPDAQTTFRGANWWTPGGAVASATGTSLVPVEGLPTQVVETSFVGQWDSNLDLVLNPVFSVCVVVVGCFDLVDVDVPIPLAGDSFQQEMAPLALAFPLPLLRTDYDTYDFGEVTVGSLQNLELPISNDGDLLLEGIVSLTGSPYFTSYPDAFLAAPLESDGLVVTFTPESEGPFEATLTLVSNDPGAPERTVRLTGIGVPPDESSGDGTGDDTNPAKRTVITSEVGCGCASAESHAAAPALLGALGLLLVVRRRRPTA